MAWWAVPQIFYLSMAFHYSFYSPAVISEYDNSPLPTMPGPLWLYALFALAELLMWAATFLLLPLALVGSSRVRRLAPVGTRWRTAWRAALIAGLAIEAAMWKVTAWGDSLHGRPDLMVLAFALGFAGLAVVMINVLRGAQAGHYLTSTSDTNQLGLGGIAPDQ